MSRTFKFKDDEIEGSVNIVVSHITSYGITTSEFNDNTGLPNRGIVWVNVNNMNFNRNLSYDHAVSVEEDITEAIHLAMEDE